MDNQFMNDYTLNERSEEYKNKQAEEWELRCLSLKTPEQIYKALTEVISAEDAIDIMVNSKETVAKIMAEINEHPTYRHINGFITDEFLRGWCKRYDFDLTGLVNFLDVKIKQLEKIKEEINIESDN
jgi:hypothetical protein